jgi:hypothetical protein
MSRLIPLIAASALFVFLQARCQVPPSKSQPAAGAIIQNRYLLYAIGPDGRNQRFIDRGTGRNYARPDSPCALVKCAARDFPATSASFKDGLLKLQFAGAHTEAVIRIQIKPTHLLYQVVSLTGSGVDEFVFADIPLTLRGLPDEPFAGSVMALNLQTLVRDFPQPLSRLTASCFPKFGFAGAQVAVIACPPADLRRITQEVVTQAQALPKSPLGGPWAWDAQPARGSYLFDFGNLNEETADDWIRLVQSLGFTQIDFHGGRSFRFGDCRVNPEVFPRGREGFKAAIAKLHSAGISAGLHTYAFFIDKKADWVTPVPDPRLAKDATFTLAQDLSADSVTLPVVEPTEHISTVTGFFVRNSVTLRLENELITYSGVSKSPPFAFTGCKRGACGTRVTPHPRGAKLDRLKECFGLFVPDPETTLLGEVAQRTADLYNECGFDMIYLDALDGEDILGGAEFAWHYGSEFVFELANRLKKPALMEMSTFHHHLWYVRSRAGAWDHPRRAEKQFIDLHLAANETYRRMFLPANLGWWAVHNWTGAQEERTFPDDIEYLCGKALGTDSGLSLMGIDPNNAGTMSRLADTFKRYESLRHAQVVPESVKARLRHPGQEFHLVNLPQGAWEFRPARYSQHKVEAIDGLNNLWTVQNDFARQPLRLRIEALLAAEPYDSSTNQVLADAESLVTFTNRSSSPGVAANFGSTTELVKAGAASLRLSATNSSNSARGAWAKFERTFTTPLNLSGQEGIGLWVHGDGQGELLNIQLRCPEHLVAGIGEHYVPIDFTGWRYFELVEPESRRWAQYSWPYGDAYSIYRESINFSQVSSVSLWLNNIPPGKPVTVHLSPVKALPLLKSVLHRPALTVNGNTISFPIELESGCYLEMVSAVDCKVYGPKGELKAEVKPESEPPTLDTASNQVGLEAQTDPGIRLRANVTIITEGQAVH